MVKSRRRSLQYRTLQAAKKLARDVLIAGADLNAKDDAGKTLLHRAAALNDGKLVCTLLRRGAGVDVVNSKGECALHIAVEHGRISSAQALLEAGADPNVRYTRDASTLNQCSPLYLARRNAAMTKLLLRHSADVNAQDDFGYTALHGVAESGTPRVINVLVLGGADLEARSSSLIIDSKYHFDGLTPLHAAAMTSRGSMAALLHKGANINVRDANGLTPLHVMCKASAMIPSPPLKMADFLLRRGADETITDNDGNTPKDLIESGADHAKRLHRLLANAPADRTWRRRGILVLCRARSTKQLGGVGGRKVGKIPCHGREAGAGAAGADGRGCVLTRVVGLEIEEVFRSIVRFL